MAVTSRKAFTLLELVVVIGILMILASILLPVIANSRQAGREAATKSNLRQIYLGLMIYRETYDSKVEYGSTIEMALPVNLEGTSAYLEVVRNKDVWKSPCCCHADAPSGYPDYRNHHTDYAFLFTGDDPVWEIYVRKYLGDSIMVQDWHCADHSVSILVPSEPIKLIGVRLNGKIEARTRAVRAPNYEPFWNR